MAIDIGRRAVTAAGAALLGLFAVPAGAQEAPASPPPGQPRVELVRPSPAPVDRSSHVVTLRTVARGERDSAGAGRLRGWRAAVLKEGEGRLLINGVSRTVKPGQAVEGYVVKAVAPGRVVLAGPAAGTGGGRPGASVLVVIDFDAQGSARVRMVFDVDPTAELTAQPSR